MKLKTLEDIKEIKKANQIIARLYNDILPKYIKPGTSTYEIDKIVEDFIRTNGAIPGTKGYDIGMGYPPYPSASCISVNEKVVHGIPSKDEILKEGDIVSVDTVAVLNGYYGDSAITYPVGNIDEKSQKLLDVTKKALYLGIEQAKVGNRIGDISSAIQSYVEMNGFSVVRDFSGHGVGFSMHEDPYVLNYGKAGTMEKIESGLVIAIEPMVNMGSFKVRVLPDKWTVVTRDKSRSAHFEHSVAILKDKTLILSELD